MKIRMAGSEDVLEGSAHDIVSALKSRAFGQDHLSPGEYAVWMAQQVRVRVGKLIDVGSGTDSLKCEMLLRELASNGLAEMLEE